MLSLFGTHWSLHIKGSIHRISTVSSRRRIREDQKNRGIETFKKIKTKVAMKLLLFATALIIVTYAAVKPQGYPGRLVPAKNQGPALADEGLAKRDLTRSFNGYRLTYGCDRRHTYLDGKCWSYCGVVWTSGEWCYTRKADGTKKACKDDKDCYHFVDKCASACSL